MESYLCNAMQYMQKYKPSPPSEIVSDRPLERLIFGVATKNTQTEKISSCYLRRSQDLAQGGNCDNVPLVYR